MAGSIASALAQHHAPPPPDIQSNLALNSIEIVTGLAASAMAFQAALAYRAGRLGKGMLWVTLGMVIMAVGHIILVLKRIAHFDVLGFLGDTGSFIGFSVAVFASFVFSGLGFWMIRHQADHYQALESQPSKTHRTGDPSRTK